MKFFPLKYWKMIKKLAEEIAASYVRCMLVADHFYAFLSNRIVVIEMVLIFEVSKNASQRPHLEQYPLGGFY